MALVYVRSGAGGAGTGADWANAYTTLGAALTAKSAGDKFFVSEDHSHSQASAMTLTSPGTSGNPCQIICVDHTGSVPPVSADLRTTALEATTGANSLLFLGYVSRCYGVHFSCGGGGANSCQLGMDGSTNGAHWVFDNSPLELATTKGDGNAYFIVGGNFDEGLIELVNSNLKFGSTTGQVIYPANRYGKFVWRGGAIDVTGSVPIRLFGDDNGVVGRMIARVEGIDISFLGAHTLNAGTIAADITLSNCKLPSGMTVATPISHAAAIRLINCDSGATNYRTECYTYPGSQVTETTIVRTGGATNGTTPFSWKIVTNANTRPFVPFESLPISTWNDTTAANVTVTLYGIWGGGAVPNSDDIWFEAQYEGDSGSPQGSFKSSGIVDVLAAGVALTTDASTWGGSTTKFKMSVTLTSPQPQQKGPITIRVYAGKASSTFYIDPNPVLS